MKERLRFSAIPAVFHRIDQFSIYMSSNFYHEILLFWRKSKSPGSSSSSAMLPASAWRDGRVTIWLLLSQLSRPFYRQRCVVRIKTPPTDPPGNATTNMWWFTNGYANEPSLSSSDFCRRNKNIFEHSRWWANYTLIAQVGHIGNIHDGDWRRTFTSIRPFEMAFWKFETIRPLLVEQIQLHLQWFWMCRVVFFPVSRQLSQDWY